MPRLAQLVHGFPPRENAGTEQYARRVADGLRARGWEVLTIAAAPRPGAPMYGTEEDPRLVRITNNAPYATLRRAASDRAIDRIVGRVLDRFRPDVIHVQHLQNLSVSVPLPAPTVWTLHDAWAWCAAGGLLLREGQPCEGPGAACAACASRWARDPPAVIRALGVAERLAPLVSPARLHAAWRRVPAALRGWALRGEAPPVSGAGIAARSAAILAFAGRCARIVSPSRWLAAEARRHGLPEALVLPHGVDATRRSGATLPSDAPFVFLGTLAPHKGPHLVVAAHRLAGVAAPLRVHGPVGPDPAYAAALPHLGPVAAGDVPALLASARALVLGSLWPENAPLVILEARAAGCPVIAPAIGGIPEIVTEGTDGWLYRPGDVADLSRKFRAAMTERPRVDTPPAFSAHLDALTAVYLRAMEGRA